MPFGLTTAPSVYQSINNVLASLMRQYLIPNVLYIGLLPYCDKVVFKRNFNLSEIS